jgi:hypothetical protein
MLGSGAGAFPVEHYATINHDPIKRNIEKFSPAPPGISAALNTLTDLNGFGSATEAELQRALSGQAYPRMVTVYDVGQGNSLRSKGFEGKN